MSGCKLWSEDALLFVSSELFLSGQNCKLFVLLGQRTTPSSRCVHVYMWFLQRKMEVLSFINANF